MKKETEQLVKIIDFWQKIALKNNLYPRDILEKIDLKGGEIRDFVGPRRIGKSSVLKLIIKRLGLRDNFLYLNFEDPFFIGHNDPRIIEEAVEIFQEYFNPGLEYIFFDEIQEIIHWEKAVRKLRDGGNCKIFITGSSSKLLSREMSSLITGRHLSCEILPLSFSEFLNFGGISLKNKKDVIVQQKKILRKFDEYLVVGGFPEIAITKDEELLKNYFNDILQKDIVMRHDIRDKGALEKMAAYLMSNSGKIISIESLKENFRLSFASASAYLDYFKESFLVFELPQFSFSLKKQNKALKKIYAVDTGLANSVSFKFSEDRGRVLENVIFLELRRMGMDAYYYKTRDNLEVDFLAREKNKPKILIQASWSIENFKTRERETKALLAAMEETGLRTGIILTHDEKDEIKIGANTVKVVPVYEWFLGENR